MGVGPILMADRGGAFTAWMAVTSAAMTKVWGESAAL
jgi:hypothetical protein